MSVLLRQSTLHQLNPAVRAPGYDRAKLTPGILHIGVGNFHRAHQAMYLDELLARGDGNDWAIVGGGWLAQDARMRACLAHQDWLSSVTCLGFDDDAPRVTRVCGSMIDFVAVEPGALIDALADPQIRIVSLTISEGGYFVNQAGAFDRNHPHIAHDRAHPHRPKTVFGALCAALSRRRREGVPPFTLMSCDNLPGNGDAARRALIGAAAPELALLIAEQVACPNGMVDCITPATDARVRALAESQLGAIDRAPVICESHRQWVLEDRFPNGRPPLEDVGVVFTDDVGKHELRKLRIVNGGHACIAYAGALLGIVGAADAMRHPLIRGYLHEVATREILPSVRGFASAELRAYLHTAERRFANADIGDTIARLCMDGSNRQPKFILPTIVDQLDAGRAVDGLALEVALWCRYCVGADVAGNAIEVHDARAAQLREHARAARHRPEVFLQIDEVFGALARAPKFVDAFGAMVTSLWQHGVESTLRRYLTQTD